MERYKPKKEAPKGGDYFPPNGPIKFIPSGSILLDCVIGRGWPLGRIVNIIGDKSVGKTLLAVEACANFHVNYPKGHIWYREAESAFDLHYAELLGLPAEKVVDFGPEGIDSDWDTIEKISADLEACIEKAKKSGQPGLYIIDSLDALSSEAELKRKPGDGTFGTEKPKEMSRMFRTLVRKVRQANICLIVISQVRDKIGYTVGRKQTRSGGKALGLYSSIVLWLAHTETKYREVGKIKRATAVVTHVKCEKNKISKPFRECHITLRFSYGIDDLAGVLDWLEDANMLSVLNFKDVKAADKFYKEVMDLPPEERRERTSEVRSKVIEAWESVEARFEPKYRKYA